MARANFDFCVLFNFYIVGITKCHLSERLGYITSISGPFLVRKTGIGSTLLLAFRTFFPGKRVRKAKNSMPHKYSPKEGGTTGNFQIMIFALFSLLDSGNNEMCYFKGPGDRIEASRRPLGGTKVDLWKPFGAS